MRHYALFIIAFVCLVVIGFRPNASSASQTVRTATACNGVSANGFPCSNINLLAQMPLNTLTGSGIEGNDVWGWTDSRDGREYAIMGLEDGTAFVDVTNPIDPILIGHLEAHTANSSWRDIKVHSDHAYIGSEATNHGIQIFDLRQLRDIVETPVTLSETGHYNGVGSSHNVVANEGSDYVFAVGARNGTQSGCAGGLHMMDVRNPSRPSFAGCFETDGYTHDAQCVIYNGPDTEHAGKEICFNSNEDTVTIVDISDKDNPIQLSRTPYDGAEYTHQGWLTEDQSYFISNDELDEQNNGHNTHTFIWDVRDLDSLAPPAVHVGDSANIDHNLYTKDGLVYQANYRAGLRILDAADIANGNLTEIGYFDIYPNNNSASFNGAWSTFPYFDSGLVIISGIEQGLFTVRPAFDAGYALAATPSRVAQCGDGSQTVALSAEQILDFGSTVNLTISGAPAGLTVTPSATQVNPGDSINLTVEANSVAGGSYSIMIDGDASGSAKSTSLLVHLTPDMVAPQLVSPANDAAAVGRRPVLSWQPNGATSYNVQVSTDANFGSFVVDTTTTATSYAISSNLDDNTTYFWRISGSNQCGESDFSSGTFTTLDKPVVDPNMTHTLFESGAEGNTSDWTLGGDWAVTTDNPHQGNSAFAIAGDAASSGSVLLSPSVTIPAGETPAILSFWQTYSIEQGAIGCFDSAVIEISTNGINWQRLTNLIYGSPYNGFIANKTAGLVSSVPAWCGEQGDWEEITVDLSDYAGEEVTLRFKFSSDQSVASDGWLVDDIRLLSTGEEPEFNLYLPTVVSAP